MDAAKILCRDQLPLGTAISPAGGYVECPNSEIPLNFDSPQIETARDGIMWIAQIMGCFARVNRLGILEFIPIKSWWKMYDETNGTILAVRDIGGGSSFKTKFSDDRIHIVGVTMRNTDGKLVTKRYNYSHESGGDPTSDVTMELETNPLIIGSETPLEKILDNILSELSTAYFYAFQTEITNDPALDAGDTIRLKGGVINGTNKNNDLIGFITHSTWIYRKRQTITNASSVPIVYEDAASGIALMSEDGISPQADSEPLNFLPPRSQSDKAQLGIDTSKATSLIFKPVPDCSMYWENPASLVLSPGRDNSNDVRVHIVGGTIQFSYYGMEVRLRNDGYFYLRNRDGKTVFEANPFGGVINFSDGNGKELMVNLSTSTIKINGKRVLTE